ncbi:heme o synthase [Methylomonas sp. MED-D]|uniref:Protoheme IX farnesyltransferase n=1 Tax=Methylomonas koyamae TaxID=702114 RepID=A0A177NNY2_9GAMM|nr:MULTISPECIES: heme o synthase [Methylomonas]NJA04495.1 protoheme IX farnesyltransferase [Methylococcaceae bacterium WWC4]MDT4331949.1 heme o synthase [Methylomonas sp. MV1]OAI18750.1 protoheme IX farnesyltransferase [Methylomonas koyamae]OHX35818.1 protoheme IX farnesyltransferase [Methylomonas sp. LWB]WGS88557.1 heme o synthase [Methylomonas sp. UP202]
MRSRMTDKPALSWKNYLELCKPRVVALIVFTAIVGMLLAVPGMPPLALFVYATIGIGLAASSAAAINHFIDQEADAEMARTRNRPLPTGELNSRQVLLFAAAIGLFAMGLLAGLVNVLTAVLTFLSLIGYAFVYTIYLKKATPQNIVIGGAAGAAPPVLGWAAMTGNVHPHALLLFLIIFVWTPPHFWALAIAKREEYAKVSIPMLPVTHGVEFTRLQILLYTILLLITTLLPYLTGMTGLIYLASAVLLGLGFLYYAVQMMRKKDNKTAMRTFGYSIVYLMLIFAALLIDHYFPLSLS